MNARCFSLSLLCVIARLAVAGEEFPPPNQESSALLLPSASYAEQMSAVKDGRYGTPELLVLLQDSEATSGMEPNQERAVLNEVMNNLRLMEDANMPLEDILMGVASDSGRDPGVREYAVQHLLLWHSKTEQKAKVEDYLWLCTEDAVLSSVAILQLHHLEMDTKHPLSKPLAPVVLKAMARTDLRNSDRITLLLVAAESGMTKALLFARDWAETATDRVVLQAALTAIGKLGSPQDLAFLDKLETSRNLDEVRETVEYTRNHLAAGSIKGATQ